MQRRDFIKLAGMTAAVAFSGGGCSVFNDSNTQKKMPNIILVVSDDQGYGDFECFGNEHVKTPNLNALYKKSAWFENFYVCPVCAPTRAGLMTGRYNYRTGVWDTWKARMNMHNDEVTVAEVLRDNGYRTGIFGKWHLGYNCPTRPLDQGFEEAVTFYGTQSRFDPVLDVNGEKKKFDGFLTDIFFDEAISFIKANGNSDKSFFAYVPSFLPHYFPAKQVPDADVEFYSEIEGLCPLDKETYAMVTRFDSNLGRLLDAVEQTQIEDNTVIIFLSDNGADIDLPLRKEGCQNKRYNMGLRDGKGSVYEGGIRVPCFVHWKGVTNPDAVIHQIAANIDIMPTILEICGVSDSSLELDGVSLMPLLTGGKFEYTDRALCFKFQRAAVPDKWTNSCIREQDLKLVNGNELYNITQDAGERSDISGQYPDQVERLREKYSLWFDDVVSTRGFAGERIIIGSDRQPCIRFKYWNQVFGEGWQVEVAGKGPYSIRMTQVQNQLLNDETMAVVSFDGSVISQQPFSGKDMIEFDNIELPTKKGMLRVWFRGLKHSKMPYGEKDPGYRFVFVERKN
ncbi:MAG: arylsulfatase [Sedimentisphaeraceae bacterium JB056]